MTQSKDTRMEITRSIIEEIFTHPPINQAELVQRLSSVDRSSARRVLTERLQRSLVGEEEFGLFLEVFSHLGIGEEREGLTAVVNGKENDTLARTLAMTLLAEDDPEYLNADMEGIDPEDFSKLADRPLIELMTAVEVDPDTARDVTDFLLESPEEIREFLLFRLGCCRRETGVSAVTAYAHALRCQELSDLHGTMLDAIIEEGGQDAVDLLGELRESAVDPQMRRRFQGALMRINTRAIDPRFQAESPAGSAYVASCDGQGAFILLGFFKKPNGSSTTANLCIQAASDLRDGFVLPRHSQKELKGMMKQLREGTGCEFASISLHEAAAIAAEAVERTRALDLSIPDDARSAIRLFQRVQKKAGKRQARPDQLECDVSLREMRRLLKKNIYRNWFFDTGDLVSARVRLPARNKTSKKWFDDAARKLDRPAIGKRLVAMAEHMAQWHAWRGESELSALCASAARQTEKDFENSALVRAMLERTVQTAPAGDEDDEVMVFGAPEVRQYLKSKFFQQLKSPRGKHLALLDFTEVALTCLDGAVSVIPGERRPRDETKPMMALTIARGFRNIIQDRRGRSVDTHMQSMARALARVCRLRKRECLEIGAMVTLELNLFVDEVCSECPVACLQKPNRIVADVFFSPHHPVDALYDEHGDNDGWDHNTFMKDELWDLDLWDDDDKPLVS